jgi:hypothetical protein
MVIPNNGPWASPLVLASKPHQEHVQNIADFIWRMCVSYRRLNRVTRPFRFPIARCSDSTQEFGDSHGELFFIALDAFSGFHQIKVDLDSQDKLAFWGPDAKKYTYTVLPFGPTNGPAVYQAFMEVLRGVWNRAMIKDLALTNESEAFYTTKLVIDDILLVSNNPDVLVRLFRHVCTAFVTYRLSFKLTKCDFFLHRLEFLGIDLSKAGNLPAQSKFNLINNWPLPATSQSLHSFISLCGFYRQWLPMYELRIAPFRRIISQHKHSRIPQLAWTPDIIALFEGLKHEITSSPCLARADSDKPFFVKSDWAAIGMGCILMQPDDSPASVAAMAKLARGEPCEFDRTLTGPRLRPVAFYSRRCTDKESHFHSFVGEAACGRWAIAKNRRYLWGKLFYWVCDCSAISALVEYDGDNHMLRRWAQDLLGYDFITLHRPERMMRDVDALSRCYDKLVRAHVLIATANREATFASTPAVFLPIPLSELTAQGTLATFPPCVPTTGSTPITTAPVHHLYHQQEHRANPTPTNPSPPPNTTLYPATTQTYCTLLASHGRRHEERSAASIDSDLCLRHERVRFAYSAPALIPPPRSPSALEPLPLQAFLHLSLPLWLSWNSTLGGTVPSLNLAGFSSVLLFEDDASDAELLSHLYPDCISTVVLPTVGPTRTLDQYFPASVPVVGYDCTCHHRDLPRQLRWLDCQLDFITHLFEHRSLQGFLLLLPTALPDTRSPSTDRSPSACLITACTPALDRLQTSWCHDITPVLSSHFGDALAQSYVFIRGLRQSTSPTAALSDTISPIYRTTNDTTSYLPYISSSLDLPHQAVDLREFDLQPRPTHPALLGGPIIHQVVHDPLTAATVGLILQPHGPGFVTSYDPSDPFCGSFGIRFTAADAKVYYRAASTHELLQMLGYDFSTCDLVGPICIAGRCRLISRVPAARTLATFLEPLATHLYATASLLAPLSQVSRASEPLDSRPCLIATAHVPSSATWTTAYLEDPDTAAIVTYLQDPNRSPWTKKALLTLNPQYRPLLRDNLISLDQDRLLLHQPIVNETRQLLTIIVPRSLRLLIFTAYHATPIAGHLGASKTLVRLRLRFFWPRMRTFVETGIKSCPECILSNSVHRASSDLLYGTTTDEPMQLLHIDAFAPGETLSFRNNTGILTIIDDMTGFVIVTEFTSASSSTFARLFVSQVLLKHGLCLAVVIDADSKFRGLFEAMCTALGLRWIALSRGNHQGMRSERFHRYLNKALTNECSKRDTNEIFVEVAYVAAYAWNSTPIDGTDIVRSYPVTGRVFRFPLDVALDALPQPTDDPALSLQRFLAAADSTTQTSRRLLLILNDERRSIQRERINERRTEVIFAVGDIVTARVQIQSDKSKGRVGKLAYRARGPFIVVTCKGHGSYLVRRFDDPNAPLLSYKSSQLSALPPTIRPCHPLDTIDYRYLNQDRAPVLHPHKHSLGIDSYNHLWLGGDAPIQAPSPPLDQSLLQLSQPWVVDATNPFFEPIADLTAQLELELAPTLATPLAPDLDPASPSDPPPDFILLHSNPSLCPPDPSALYRSISLSTDQLFFVRYIPSGTMTPCLHLVQVNLENSAACRDTTHYRTDGRYYCEFLTQFSRDTTKPWDSSRWRTEWHEYSRTADNEIEYGARREFPPQRIPDYKRYIAWADFLPLCDATSFIYGPFDFADPLTNPNQTSYGREFISASTWQALATCLLSSDITPPPLSFATTDAASFRATKRRRTKRS